MISVTGSSHRMPEINSKGGGMEHAMRCALPAVRTGMQEEAGTKLCITYFCRKTAT
jgi:hypothetical protein